MSSSFVICLLVIFMGTVTLADEAQIPDGTDPGPATVDRIQKLTDLVCTELQQRAEVVQDTLDFLHSRRPECMDHDHFEAFSTPNRDARLFHHLLALRHAYRESFQQDQLLALPVDLNMKLQKVFPYIMDRAKDEAARMRMAPVDTNSLCPLAYGTNKVVDLAEAKRRLFAGVVSNNPLEEVEYRWGERSGPSPRAKFCPVWDTWTPDLENAE